MRYRSPIDGGRYAAWLRRLRGKSGVYVVRESWSGTVLYVGESHTGHLYKTITRHFQSWSGATAGTYYHRDDVVVAVLELAANKARRKQDELIKRLSPRDNTYKTAPGGDFTPF